MNKKNKKYKKYLIVLVLVICIIGAIMVLKEPTPEEIRDNTVNAMNNVKAYKYSMAANTATDNLSINGETDLKNKRARLKISLTSEGTTIPVETYVVDDVSYLKIFGQWTKKTLSGSLEDEDNVKNLIEILKISRVNLIKNKSNESFYVLEVMPDNKKLLEYLEKQTEAASDFKDIKTNMIVWVSKKDNLVKKTEIKITDPTDENAYLIISLEISDYLQQLDIKLPEEAKTARWASESGSENGSEDTNTTMA